MIKLWFDLNFNLKVTFPSPDFNIGIIYNTLRSAFPEGHNKMAKLEDKILWHSRFFSTAALLT